MDSEVTDDHNANGERLAAARQAFVGRAIELEEVLHKLGGWEGVASLAAHLTDDPLLVPVTTLTAEILTTRDVNAVAVSAAALALAGAAVASTDPYLFGQTVDLLCSCSELVALVGTPLATALWPIAQPPAADPEGNSTAVQRSADALEAYLRLTLADHGSKNRLFTLFEDVKHPLTRRYAQAVIRSVHAAHDCWDLDEQLVEAIDILSGTVAPRESTPAATASAVRWSQDQSEGVASDAAWAKANIELVRALRAPDVTQMLDHLEEARSTLAPALGDESCSDATVLASVLDVLITFLRGASSSLDEWDVDVDTIAALQTSLEHYELGALGLQHWATERKRQLLAGWSKFTANISFLKDKLQQPSLYDAATVLDGILDIYLASRSGDIVARPGDLDGVRRIVQPSIVRSFATRAGLFRHLEDHVHELRRRTADTNHPRYDDAAAKLPIAELVLTSARREMLGAVLPGKDVGVAVKVLPPLLNELISSDEMRAALAQVDTSMLAQLSQDLEDRRFGSRTVPHIVISNVTRKIRAALAGCPDYTGDVKDEVDHLVDLLVRFLHARMNIESRYKPYLYKADANEQNLHLDLFDWLAGQDIAGYVGIEVTNIAGGRADIQLSYGAYHLYIELKADDTQVALADKSAYIQQAVAYQGSDVQISFLVVLRLAKEGSTSAPPHLSTLVSHTTVHIGEGTAPRHVVMIEVPGNRLTPSSMR